MIPRLTSAGPDLDDDRRPDILPLFSSMALNQEVISARVALSPRGFVP